jgi:hypothetical protein
MYSKWMTKEYLKLHSVIDPNNNKIWNMQGKGGLISKAACTMKCRIIISVATGWLCPFICRDGKTMNLRSLDRTALLLLLSQRYHNQYLRDIKNSMVLDIYMKKGCTRLAFQRIIFKDNIKTRASQPPLLQFF